MSTVKGLKSISLPIREGSGGGPQSSTFNFLCSKSSAKLGVFRKITKKVSKKPPNLWSIYLKSLILHAVCAIKRTEYKKMAEKKPAKS